MPVIARLVAPLTLLLALITAPLTASAQVTGCQYILGFQTLHDLDPADVGACTDNQAFAANGDALQHTINGLLVWRKADNFTAFTNGATSWVNGPNGLQQRPNNQRFSWEANPDGLPIVNVISPQAIAYFQRMLPAIQVAHDSLAVISQQSALAGADPTVMLTSDWTVKTAVALYELQTAGQTFQSATNVPTDLNAINAGMVSLGQELIATTNDFAQGVDQRNSFLLQSAASHLQTATGLIRGLAQRLDTYRQAHGGT